MVQEIKVNVTGTWQLVTEVSAKVSGSIKDILEVQTRVGGIWRTVFLKELFALTGTSGNPNTATDFAIIPAHAQAGWIWNLDGTVDRESNGSIDIWQAGVEWTNFQPNPGDDIWLRATLDNGTPPNVGNSLDIWHKIGGSGSSNAGFKWDTDGGPDQFLNDSLKIELSTDSGGSTIVATGYYGISDVSREP